MAEQQRLLVPLDGSEVAEAALPYAETIARVLGGSLHLLAVVELEPGGVFALAPEIRDQLAQGQRDEFAAGRLGEQFRQRRGCLPGKSLHRNAVHARTAIVLPDVVPGRLQVRQR